MSRINRVEFDLQKIVYIYPTTAHHKKRERTRALFLDPIYYMPFPAFNSPTFLVQFSPIRRWYHFNLSDGVT